MPLYEYACEACGKRFEVIQKFSDAPIEVCTQCGQGPVRKLMSSPAIQFKGTGWYITDYSQKGKSGSDSAGSGTSDAKSADAKASETKSAETKSGDSSPKTDPAPSTAASTSPTPAPAASKD